LIAIDPRDARVVRSLLEERLSANVAALAKFGRRRRPLDGDSDYLLGVLARDAANVVTVLGVLGGDQ
jgi:hypothetical protein